MDSMNQIPCTRVGAHYHELTWNQEKNRGPGTIQFACGGGDEVDDLAWVNAARALLRNGSPTLDGKPLEWGKADAWAYLLALPERFEWARAGITPPRQPASAEGIVKCRYCDWKFNTADELDDHVVAGHRDAPNA